MKWQVNEAKTIIMKTILNHEKTNLTLHFYLIKIFKLQANWVTNESVPSCRAIQNSPPDFPWKTPDKYLPKSREVCTQNKKNLKVVKVIMPFSTTYFLLEENLWFHFKGSAFHLYCLGKVGKCAVERKVLRVITHSPIASLSSNTSNAPPLACHPRGFLVSHTFSPSLIAISVHCNKGTNNFHHVFNIQHCNSQPGLPFILAFMPGFQIPTKTPRVSSHPTSTLLIITEQIKVFLFYLSLKMIFKNIKP